jgi:uncharacterized protein YbjT (DUF2867 family)
VGAPTNNQGRVVLLAGASGLSGGCALEALINAADVSRVVAVSRRPLQRDHGKVANRIVQFGRLESQLQGTRCDVALSCLGTTIRQAGSREAFRAVDLDTVLSFARAARACGARRLIVMSSAGADPRSRNFYLRTKGEMEEELEGLGFESLDFMQPSVLLGWRAEMRPLELAARLLLPLLNPLLLGRYSVYRGIPARTVAAAMLGAMRSGRRGVQRYTHDGIEALARVGARAATPAGFSAAPATARRR